MADPTDIASLFYDDEPTAKQKLAAYTAALRGQQGMAGVAELTGDPVLSKFGTGLADRTQRQQDALAEVPQRRLNFLKMTREENAANDPAAATLAAGELTRIGRTPVPGASPTVLANAFAQATKGVAAQHEQAEARDLEPSAELGGLTAHQASAKAALNTSTASWKAIPDPLMPGALYLVNERTREVSYLPPGSMSPGGSPAAPGSPETPPKAAPMPAGAPSPAFDPGAPAATPTAPTGRAVLKGARLTPVAPPAPGEPMPATENMGVSPMPPPPGPRLQYPAPARAAEAALLAKLPAEVRTQIDDLSNSVPMIDKAIDAVKKHPGAFGPMQDIGAQLPDIPGVSVLGRSISTIQNNRRKPEDTEARSTVLNATSAIEKALGGARAFSQGELGYFNKIFADIPHDNAKTILAKLNVIRDKGTTTLSAMRQRHLPQLYSDQPNPGASAEDRAAAYLQGK